MGIVLSYYLVKKDILEKVKEEKLNLYDYIENELMMYHQYNNNYFWNQDNSFGQGIKSWNPMIELINHLDSSESSVCKKILSEKNYISETYNHPNLYYIYHNDIQEIFEEIKKISLSSIETTLQNHELKKEIKNMRGYRMEEIDNIDSILKEFVELFNAFYHASKFEKELILTLE